MDGNNRYEPWPQEIRVCEEGAMLSLSFDNGEKLSISAELLRVESPSADIQNHGGPKIIIRNTISFCVVNYRFSTSQ